jgi:hypothetical protein
MIIVLTVTYMPTGIDGLLHRFLSIRRFRFKREVHKNVA